MEFQTLKNVGRVVLPFLAFILLFYLTFGCSRGIKKAEFEPGEEWITDMRERIEASIDEPNKKNQMLLMVDQIEDDLIKLNQTIRKHYADLFTIDRNYEALPEDFRKQFAHFNRSRYQIRNQIIETRFQLKELVTPEEWKKLTDVSKKKGLFKISIQFPDL